MITDIKEQSPLKEVDLGSLVCDTVLVNVAAEDPFAAATIDLFMASPKMNDSLSTKPLEFVDEVENGAFSGKYKRPKSVGSSSINTDVNTSIEILKP
jgi:hypothetical protein